jgi:hypothetical protein
LNQRRFGRTPWVVLAPARSGEGTARSDPGPRGRLVISLLGLCLLGSALVLYVEGRETSFFNDEWDFILDRRRNSVSTFLAPHNGHLSLIPIAVYRLLFLLVGLRHYGPYRLVLIALHLTVGTLVFVLVRRRAGTWIGLMGAGLILFLGRGWSDLIWPFQIGYLASIAGGLGALAAIDRDDRRGDVTAAGLLLISDASSGLGVPLTVGAAVALLLSRRLLARAWVVAVPAFLYGLWYLRYGESVASASNISAIPGYVFDSFGGAVGALTGLSQYVPRPETAIALAMLGVVIVARRPELQILVPASIALSFWTLTALSRAQLHEPTNSRYLYPGAIMLVLVVAELLRGISVPRAALVVLAGLTAISVGLNMYALRDGASGKRSTDQIVDAELRALELERAVAPPNFRPDPTRAPQVTAVRYFRTVDALGSPALPQASLPTLSPDARSAVDAVLLSASPPRIEKSQGTSIGAPGCRREPAGRVTDVVVPAAGLIVHARKVVRLDLFRYGDLSSTKRSWSLPPGSTRLRFRPDGDHVPWRAAIRSAAPFVVCD